MPPRGQQISPPPDWPQSPTPAQHTPPGSPWISAGGPVHVGAGLALPAQLLAAPRTPGRLSDLKAPASRAPLKRPLSNRFATTVARLMNHNQAKQLGTLAMNIATASSSPFRTIGLLFDVIQTIQALRDDYGVCQEQVEDMQERLYCLEGALAVLGPKLRGQKREGTRLLHQAMFQVLKHLVRIHDTLAEYGARDKGVLGRVRAAVNAEEYKRELDRLQLEMYNRMSNLSVALGVIQL